MDEAPRHPLPTRRSSVVTTNDPAVPDSPAARRGRLPRWWDTRVVVGVLLVLVSVVVGVRVVSASAEGVPVWAASRALEAGAVVGDGDVRLVEAVLDDATLGSYLGRGADPRGQVLARAVGEDEVLPVGAVQGGEGPALRLVSVPVEARHAPPPDVLRGARVDVWATWADGSAASSRLVLADVPVREVEESGVGSGVLGVVLAVAPDRVGDAVAALQADELDVVVRRGQDGPTTVTTGSAAPTGPTDPGSAPEPLPTPPAAGAADAGSADLTADAAEAADGADAEDAEDAP